MKRFPAAGRNRVAAALLAVALAGGLSGCADAPDLERLAPTMPKMKAEVPETVHPETKNSQFPNINKAPDRISVMHSDQERKQIEKSLEEVGDEHVKEAVTSITGKPPEEEKKSGKGKKGDDAAKKTQTSGTPATSPKESNQPLQLTPPPSNDPS